MTKQLPINATADPSGNSVMNDATDSTTKMATNINEPSSVDLLALIAATVSEGIAVEDEPEEVYGMLVIAAMETIRMGVTLRLEDVAGMEPISRQAWQHAMAILEAVRAKEDLERHLNLENSLCEKALPVYGPSLAMAMNAVKVMRRKALENG